MANIQTDAFVVDNNGTLNVLWVVQAGDWGGPLGVGPAGFAPAGAAVAASQQIGLNQTDVFVVDSAGQLNVSWVDNAGAWSGPLGIGPAGIFPPGAPVAASQQIGLNQTDVFVVDNNGALNVAWVVEAGAWGGAAPIGPAGTFPPGAHAPASRQFGGVDPAGRGPGGQCRPSECLLGQQRWRLGRAARDRFGGLRSGGRPSRGLSALRRREPDRRIRGRQRGPTERLLGPRRRRLGRAARDRFGGLCPGGRCSRGVSAVRRREPD